MQPSSILGIFFVWLFCKTIKKEGWVAFVYTRGPVFNSINTTGFAPPYEGNNDFIKCFEKRHFNDAGNI